MSIPVVDFSTYSLRETDVTEEHLQKLAEELKKAFVEIGFVLLTNTGITQEEVRPHQRTYLRLLNVHIYYCPPPKRQVTLFLSLCVSLVCLLVKYLMNRTDFNETLRNWSSGNDKLLEQPQFKMAASASLTKKHKNKCNSHLNDVEFGVVAETDPPKHTSANRQGLRLESTWFVSLTSHWALDRC